MDAPAEHQALDDESPETVIDHRRTSRAGIPQQHRRPEEQKAFALAVYAETGSTETASRESNIPRSTIHSWIERDPEIDAKLDALRRVVRERAAHLYAEIAVRAAEELLDRVTHGDIHVDKEGLETRRPMPGRELAFVSSLAADKHALITAAVVKQRGEDSSLTKLAEGLISALDKRALRSKADAAVPQGSEPNSAD